MKKNRNAMFYFILTFSVLVFVLLVVLMSLASYQFSVYESTTGTAYCGGDLQNTCQLRFTWTDSSGSLQTNKTRVSKYYGNGTFDCQVFYRVKDDKISDVIVPAFSYTFFLGTTTYVTTFTIIAFLALINLVLCFR
jgi:hypothetical protein